MFNSMINSSWSKDTLVLLSLLFSEEGKRSRGEGKSQSAIVDSSTGRILLLLLQNVYSAYLGDGRMSVASYKL